MDGDLHVPRSSQPGSEDLDTSERSASAETFDLRAVVGAADRPAVTTDSKNKILHWNEAAARLVGVPPEEAVGSDLQDVLDARDGYGNRLCPDLCAFHLMVRRNESPRWFELDVRTTTGDRLRVEVSIVVVRGPDPGEYELIYFLMPVQRRRLADEAIDRMLARNGHAIRIAEAGFDRIGTKPTPILTPRQHQVLALVAEGHHVSDIAAEFGVSVHTVRSHVRNILTALEVHSQIEAVVVARREGII